MHSSAFPSERVVCSHTPSGADGPVEYVACGSNLGNYWVGFMCTLLFRLLGHNAVPNSHVIYVLFMLFSHSTRLHSAQVISMCARRRRDDQVSGYLFVFAVQCGLVVASLVWLYVTMLH